MWVFDGEEWVQDNPGRKPEEAKDERPEHFDEFYPELQIVEVPLNHREPVPPFPLP